VAVAAVPTTLVLTTEHQVTVTVQQQVQQQRVVLIQTIKKTGDDLIVKLQSAETSCNAQVTQLVSTSKVQTAKLQTRLVSAQAQIHGSITPFIAAIRQSEDHFANLTVLTPDDEQNELNTLQLISITALGEGQTIGVVVVTCQTVVIEIKVIVVEVEHHIDEGDGD
jgi:hypothetical protein